MQNIYLCKKQKEELERLTKEKDLKRKEKLAKKVLGGEVSCKLEYITNNENNEKDNLNKSKFNRGSESRIERP